MSELPWGAFGENLTTEGLLEGTVRIGDRLRAGSVELVVTQPRTPCFKLGIRLNRDDMVKRFMRSRRSGFYLSVVEEGTLTAGDPVEFTRRDEHEITVAEVVDLETDGVTDRERLHRAIAVTALSEGWKRHFRGRLSGGR